MIGRDRLNSKGSKTSIHMGQNYVLTPKNANGLLSQVLYIEYTRHAATGNIFIQAWKKQRGSWKEISTHQISTSQSSKRRYKISWKRTKQHRLTMSGRRVHHSRHTGMPKQPTQKMLRGRRWYSSSTEVNARKRLQELCIDARHLAPWWWPCGS